MTQATVHYISMDQMHNFYFTKNPGELAAQMYENGQYEVGPTVDFEHYEDEYYAEELFDLTNNPMRQGEREVRFGRGRSISVGDMVEMEGEFYLCRPNGWILVEFP